MTRYNFNMLNTEDFNIVNRWKAQGTIQDQQSVTKSEIWRERSAVYVQGKGIVILLSYCVCF